MELLQAHPHRRQGGDASSTKVRSTPWLPATVRIVAAASVVASLSGCGSLFYRQTPTGVFTGKLYVEWIEPNQFIYRPDKDNPLVYTTSDGRKIEPKLMYTDGGSIPRLFWSAPSLGPWDFGPGYIIHDWLFEQQHCRIDDWLAYDFPTSARVLAEAMKTQMEKGGKPEPEIVYVVYQAVRSPIALNLWNNGKCNDVPGAKSATGAAPSALPLPPGQGPIRILTIDAGNSTKGAQP